MMNATMTPAQEAARQAISDLGLSIEASFVPYSAQSAEHKHEDIGKRQIEWRVTVKRGDRAILTTPYRAGIGHLPSYRQGPLTVDSANAIQFELERGHEYRAPGYAGKVILPDAADVLYSLVSDASVLDSGSFEEWASDYGYDTDSRKAETAYRACLDIALKLRNSIGEDGLRKLQKAFQDY
jgi:hypothetical protein